MRSAISEVDRPLVATVGTLTALEPGLVVRTGEIGGVVGVDRTVGVPVDEAEVALAVGLVDVAVELPAEVGRTGDDGALVEAPTELGTADDATALVDTADSGVELDGVPPLARVGTAVRVVGLDGIEVHDTSRVAASARPTHQPLRRSRISRPPLSSR